MRLERGPARQAEGRASENPRGRRARAGEGGWVGGARAKEREFLIAGKEEGLRSVCLYKKGSGVGWAGLGRASFCGRSSSRVMRLLGSSSPGAPIQRL
jgi:hypothetical protein